MELSRIDLNLLLVFHHLLILKRVSSVAELLNMSQPAVSSALGRLRTTLGDDLFLRTQRGMEPTPYALQLAEPVSLALDVLQQALVVRAEFEPNLTTRKFTIAMTDVGEMYFLPVLIDAISRKAPNVTLKIVSVTSTLKEDMFTGQIDLAFGLLPQLQAGFYQQALFRQKYVCLMRKNHPLAKKNNLSTKDFIHAEHVRVLSVGTGHYRVDAEFEKQKIYRNIRLTLPHYVALGEVLNCSDLIATVPQRFAQRILKTYQLAIHELPIQVLESSIHQFWHGQLHHDPGHKWLRKFINELFGDIEALKAEEAI